MYYRIAMQAASASSWRWVSTSLGSFNAVIDWLRFYNSFPRDRLRVFSAPSRDDLSEQLLRESQGSATQATPATRFLPAASDSPSEPLATPRQAVTTTQTWGNPHQFVWAPENTSMTPLDVRRDELELGVGGDHDCPYRFSLPASTPQLLAWARLLARVLHGDLQGEISISSAA